MVSYNSYGLYQIERAKCGSTDRYTQRRAS
jgi:hypothetical protein